MELGYIRGQRKPTFILLDSPDRWDVMYKFARRVCEDFDELVRAIDEESLDGRPILDARRFTLG
jgi:hypothetical protein